MTIEQVAQPEMLRQFKERFTKLIEENQQLAAKIKENETTALKLQGAIEGMQILSPEEESAETETVAIPDEAVTEALS